MPVTARLMLPCLLAALAGCVAGRTNEMPPRTAAMTRFTDITETRFTTPERYAEDMAAAATPAAAATAPDVDGVRIGVFAGHPAVLVDTPDARAAIALHGGHLMSYVPAGGEDVLWLSPRLADVPAAIRGGVPVIWPYFGRQGQTSDVPSHGFVRTLRWQLVEATRDSDGTIALTLASDKYEYKNHHFGDTTKENGLLVLEKYHQIVDCNTPSLRALDGGFVQSVLTAKGQTQCIAYRIKASNTGTLPLDRVVITDKLPNDRGRISTLRATPMAKLCIGGVLDDHCSDTQVKVSTDSNAGTTIYTQPFTLAPSGQPNSIAYLYFNTLYQIKQ